MTLKRQKYDVNNKITANRTENQPFRREATFKRPKNDEVYKITSRKL